MLMCYQAICKAHCNVLKEACHADCLFLTWNSESYLIHLATDWLFSKVFRLWMCEYNWGETSNLPLPFKPKCQKKMLFL